jgi:hypothetical protein
MKIAFERTGGFAGPAMRRATEVDTNTLPPDEAREVEKLVQQANVFGLSSPAKGSSPARDAFRYHLKFESGEKTHSIELGETEIPATLRPLIDWLVKGGSERG